MKYEVEYPVDEKMQDASMRQSILAIYLAPKLPVFGLLCVFGLCVVLVGADMHPIIRWLLPFACLIILLTWLRAYQELRAMGRKRLSMSARPLTYLSFDESEISARSANETKRYEWTKLERMVETRDFLFLLSGKMSLFCIPKSVIAREAAHYIREKMKN